MPAVTKEAITALRVDLVTATTTLDITQFVSDIGYGYSTSPPWDTVDVTLQIPLHLVDKVLPGTPVQVGETGIFVRRQEPGFWVIIWLEDWPNYRSPTAMGVGYVDTISCGEQDIPSISEQQVKGSLPLHLSCTGMLALAGKSNVRLTMSGEQNTTGFLYDLASFKGAIAGKTKNLAQDEVGITLDAIWRETIKVRGPWGQAGGRAPTAVGTGTVPAPEGAPGAPVGSFSELGIEMPVAYNEWTFRDFAPSRRDLCRPVYGKQLLAIPAMWPDSSIWQWLSAAMVPSSEVVELFATLDPMAEGTESWPAVTTALGRSLGGSQPVLCYRFKPFALKAINLANIQKQTHTGINTVSKTMPMAEQLGLFKDDLLPHHSGWRSEYYRLRDTDIFQYSFSYNDAKRCNLVFATPASISGQSPFLPFSQVGNVVIPDRAQFAHHGMRAFEVAWPYLAVHDLRETVTFKAANASQTVSSDPSKLGGYVASSLAEIKGDWEGVYGVWTTPASSMSDFWSGGEKDILEGKLTIKQIGDAWTTLRTVTVPVSGTTVTNDQTIESAYNAMRTQIAALKDIERKDPRYACAAWWSVGQASEVLVEIRKQLVFRKEQKRLIGAGDYSALLFWYLKYGYTGGMPTSLVAVAATKSNYIAMEKALYYLVQALKEDEEILAGLLEVYQKLLVPKGTVPTTATATVTGGGGSVQAAGAFKADSTLTTEFSALNELLWSIKGEGERFADMTMTIRGRPLLRQGYYIECDLGQKPSTDTVYRYCTGYIESVQHSFRVDTTTGKWESQSTLQLSRVWFSHEPGEYYTPLAASSLGNQTKSEQPNRVLRGKSVGSQNSPQPGKSTLWDLSEWSKLREAYNLPEDEQTVSDRRTSSLYPIKCFVVHHTAGHAPRATLAEWGRKNKEIAAEAAAAGKKHTDAAETAAHAEIDSDGTVYQYYNPYTSILNHARTKNESRKKKGTFVNVKNISVGFDLTGNMQQEHPTVVQEHSARMYMRMIAKEVGITLNPWQTPDSIHIKNSCSTMADLVSTEKVLDDGYTVFGHGSWERTECPGKNVDIEVLAADPGMVFPGAGSDPESAFTIIKVTDANYKDHAGFLAQKFPKVIW